MTKAQLESKLRNDCLNWLKGILDRQYACDVLPVSASELALPVTDEEGNEKWILVKVSIPRGTRNGNGGYDPYDGYAVAEDYAQDCADRAAKKKATEEKKQAKIAKDEQKRAEKKALAEANKNLKELRKIQVYKPTSEAETESDDDNYLNEFEPHELTEMLD